MLKFIFSFFMVAWNFGVCLERLVYYYFSVGKWKKDILNYIFISFLGKEWIFYFDKFYYYIFSYLRGFSLLFWDGFY